MTTRESNAEPWRTLAIERELYGIVAGDEDPSETQRVAIGHLCMEVASLREQLTAAAAENARLEALFHKTHGVHHGWVQRATECDAATARATELERDLAEAREQLALKDAQLLMVASELCADPKLSPFDVSDPRWTPTLKEAAAVRAELAACRRERDEALAEIRRLNTPAGLAAAQHQSAPSGEYRYDSTARLLAIDGVPVPAPKPAEATSAELPGDAYVSLERVACPANCTEKGAHAHGRTTPAEATASEHDYAPHPRNEGWSVCRRCGMVRNYSNPTACRGVMPKIATRDTASEPPSATPRMDAGVTHAYAKRVFNTMLSACANECGDSASLERYIDQCAELERRAREHLHALDVLEIAQIAGDQSDGDMGRVRETRRALAELLETGATKGSGDGKE